jgi:gliding motility-associated-like protein
MFNHSYILIFKILFLVVGVGFFSNEVFATHNRAGEITYKHLEGLTYEVLITTYTKASALADRPLLYLKWGDENGNDLDSLDRESIDILIGDIKVNTYRGTHTYGGPGSFELKVEDPNRNEGVLNMVGSVDTPFAIRSLLIIDPEAGHNNSVQLLNPATENACLNREWVHNPAAFDEDGDILTFSLVPCRGFNGEPIPTYEYPEQVSPADDIFEINQYSGDVTWNSPQIVGEYNIAIRIEEWREVAGQLRKVGEVVRDMQIDVQVCNNQPPVVSDQIDTCIVAGTFLTWYVNATDPDGDNITLHAVGGPISEVSNPAVFTNLGGGIGEFAWAPTCEEVRLTPYQIIFKATDQGQAIPLTDISTAYVRVVAPPVEEVSAESIGNSILLGWIGGDCSAELPVWRREAGIHDVYRRVDSSDWEPTVCETGIPDDEGYERIASLPDLSETGYVDEGFLSFGATYCYRIVMRFDDESESLASAEFCATIKKDVPVMTHADVVVTDEVLGEVNVGWSPPSEMDTLVFPLPYYYKVYRNNNQISEVTDTNFYDTGVNTYSLQHFYKVEAWSTTSEGDFMVGESIAASTPFVTLMGYDNSIQIALDVIVPWYNAKFYIERKTSVQAEFSPLDTVLLSDASPIINEIIYADTGLVNGIEYCYRLKCEGGYDAPGIESPLMNWSQVSCSIPYDFTPPCPPTLEVISNCPEEIDDMTWWGATVCSDDVMGYTLYWAKFEGDSLLPYAYFDADTTYIFNEYNQEGSIAGCFAVTASDSLNLRPGGGQARNESDFSNVVCVDNCPFYFLPNIFSPNDDDANDLFEAFDWKFIDSVDVVILNRWGGVVYKTDEIDVNWDGKHFESGEILPDGVYFYTVVAYTRRLSGIVPEKFSGNLHLVGSRNILVE